MNSIQSSSPTQVESKNLLYSFLLILAISFLIWISTFVPFWQIFVIPCIFGGWWFKKGSKAFYSIALSTILGWGSYYLINFIKNDSVNLSNYFTGLFLGNFYIGWLLISFLFIIGGFCGGIAGYFGFILHRIFQSFIEKKEGNSSI